MSEEDAAEPLRFVAVLPAHPVSVAVARGLLRGLRVHVDAERLERLELIVSEAVTNAVRHGSPRPQDRVGVEVLVAARSVTCHVDDCGHAFTPPTTAPALDRIGGFGLHIIAELAGSWSLERREAGNRVTFTV